MASGLVKEHNLEKQMGCMSGFLQIFDRHQILSGKRHYSVKRLPPLSPVTDTTSESEKSAPPSPAISEPPKPSPMAELQSPPPSKSPVLSILELKQGARSPWKFGKETPRLSLDSRATTDAKGGLHPKEIRTAASILNSATVNRCESVASDATDDSQQHRSPSVVARLMGLEFPDSCISEPESKPQLRRSASESRVSRDLFQSRFTAANKLVHDNAIKDTLDAQYVDPNKFNYIIKNAEPPKGLSSPSPFKAPPHYHCKSFFDSGDFFPEPKHTASMYGEIENRLRIRGIEEPSKDLETLKQILEALQLKGLLHSRKRPEKNQVRHRTFIYEESPIVLVEPSKLSNPTLVNRRRGNEWSPSNGSNQIRSPPVSPRRERNVRSPNRSGRSPSPTTSARNEGTSAAGRRSNSLVKPMPLSVETQRRKKESTETRRVSPIHSPKLSPRRARPDPTASNRSPKIRKSTVEIHQKEKITTVAAAEDESTSISGSSITTSTDTELSMTEDYKEGRNILERCGKLLHSIAEMTATDMQPSPVSVLDRAIYKDESSTPSPVMTRRNIDFKDQSGEIEDYEIWSPTISPMASKLNDSDFVYVSDILRASQYLPDESDVFLLLEKQQYLKGNDTSKVSKLQRKLVFDTINEILDRNNRLPPWKLISLNNHDITNPSVNKVWSEFEKIRERDDTISEDLFETVCGVLKKDLAGDWANGWGDCPMEMSNAILDIERLIFKDLISETIQDLAMLARRSRLSTMMMPRRKLVF